MIIPWNFKYNKIAELSEENQQKFIKAHPKKYQKKLKKYLMILRNDGIIIIEREVMKMTNEEKFSKGIVIYKTEDDVVCELWGSSTKHADVIYSMNRDIKNDLFARCQFADDPDYDIFQWLLYVASRQTWKTTARKIVKIALNEWY